MTSARPPKSDFESLETLIEREWPTADWRTMHVAVAVSGGPDSMALLRAALGLARRSEGPGRVFALHVNHGLRAEADEDQRWLEDECVRLGVDLVCRRVSAVNAIHECGDGVEAAARRIRYQLLTEMAESIGARLVAMGHTYDDQVETVLFRIVRGAGLRGLAGIPITRPLSPSVTLVRPLLRVRRSTVEAYLRELQQGYRRDSSNEDLRYRRNAVRRQVLPMLRDNFNSDVDDAIWRLAAQASEWNDLVDDLAVSALAGCKLSIYPGVSFSVNTAALAKQPPVLVRESLRRAWRECELPEQAMNYVAWRRLAKLAVGDGETSPISLPGDVLAKFEHGVLNVARSV